MGFKLMWVDVTVSTRLLGRVVSGHALTRREREQVRTYLNGFGPLFALTAIIVCAYRLRLDAIGALDCRDRRAVSRICAAFCFEDLSKHAAEQFPRQGKQD